MSVPPVAIITRTTNRFRLLDRCVQSVLAQDFQGWTHVIVNDGGDAREVEKIADRYRERYASRLLLLSHSKSLGMEAASNTGLRGSQSEFVAFLDDDDTWDPQFLSVMVGALMQRQDDRIKAVVCQTEIVNERLEEHDIQVEGRKIFNPDLDSINLEKLIVENRFTNNAFLFCRKAQEEIGFFDERMLALGDWDFNLRFMLRFDCAVVTRPLARWHHRAPLQFGQEDNSAALRRAWRTNLVNDAIRGTWLKHGSHLPVLLVLGSKLADLERSQTRLHEELNETQARLERLRSEEHDRVAQLSGAMSQLSDRLSGSIREYSFFVQLRLALSTRFKKMRDILSFRRRQT